MAILPPKILIEMFRDPTGIHSTYPTYPSYETHGMCGCGIPRQQNLWELDGVLHAVPTSYGNGVEFHRFMSKLELGLGFGRAYRGVLGLQRGRV